MDKKSQKRKLETDDENEKNVLIEMHAKFLEQIFPADLLGSLKSNEKLELLKLICRISVSFDFESVC